MNNLTEIFCNLNYHWHKRLSTHKSIEVEVYSGLIDLSNKVYMLVSKRGINFELSILNALLHFDFNIRWKTAHAGVSL